jgi:hypothetical protein
VQASKTPSSVFFLRAAFDSGSIFPDKIEAQVGTGFASRQLLFGEVSVRVSAGKCGLEAEIDSRTTLGDVAAPEWHGRSIRDYVCQLLAYE